MKRPRVALLGGSFDPVHIGHLHIAAVVLASGGYGRVLFVPANLPSHKPSARLAATTHRLRMLQLALAGHPRFAVSDVEVRRGGISYTVDTVRELQACGAIGERPGLVIGDDLGADLDTWREADTLFGMVELLVARRRRSPLPLAWPHRVLANHRLPISSSDLRRRVGAGQVIRNLVPEAVEAYIREQRLYGLTARDSAPCA
ncbi:MAG: nicotinate (nicotinamide) nucleotide adenylyltransferase [Spirochaetaceae bacterium]|nr:nicotinate (nicotinamide) nucleotide adenylyltransferase [Spirochaetaceae bacterium]